MKPSKPNIWEDFPNVFLLFLLYTLQGVPLGLTASIPYLMAAKGATFKDQSLLSLTSWPFSLKLFWAPIVDAWFSDIFGRRKCWLVPIQTLIGLQLLYMGSIIDSYLDAEVPDLLTLTILFTVLYFFTATQDIAVDGWSLTMLSKENVSLGPTVNSIGQVLGYHCAFTLLLALNDPETCNSYFRSAPSDEPLVTFASFLQFWGIVFLISAFAIIFKKEKPCTEKINYLSGYKELWLLIQQTDMQKLAFYILTSQIGFVAIESTIGFKLIEFGARKETFALVGAWMTPLSLVLPVFIRGYCKQNGPIEVCTSVAFYRTLMGLVCMLGVYYISTNSDFLETNTFFFLLVILLIIMNVFTTTVFVGRMIFYISICDPRFGGTHMTLLNTLGNLSWKLWQTVSMYLVDFLSDKQCTVEWEPENKDCSTMQTNHLCNNSNGECITNFDGFYVVCGTFTIIGIVWYFIFRNKFVGLSRELIRRNSESTKTD